MSIYSGDEDAGDEITSGPLPPCSACGSPFDSPCARGCGDPDDGATRDEASAARDRSAREVVTMVKSGGYPIGELTQREDAVGRAAMAMLLDGARAPMTRTIP